MRAPRALAKFHRIHPLSALPPALSRHCGLLSLPKKEQTLVSTLSRYALIADESRFEADLCTCWDERLFFGISLGKSGGVVALTCMCPVRSMHRLRVHAEGDRRDLLARWLCK